MGRVPGSGSSGPASFFLTWNRTRDFWKLGPDPAYLMYFFGGSKLKIIKELNSRKDYYFNEAQLTSTNSFNRYLLIFKYVGTLKVGIILTFWDALYSNFWYLKSQNYSDLHTNSSWENFPNFQNNISLYM